MSDESVKKQLTQQFNLKRYFILFCMLAMMACDGPFPSQSKDGVPPDHNDNKHGARHKGGAGDPFDEGGCSDSDCHQADLRGGVVIYEGRKTVTPSCYQCHGNKWEDEDDDDD